MSINLRLTEDTITDDEIRALRSILHGSDPVIEAACHDALEKGAHTFIADARAGRRTCAAKLNEIAAGKQ